MDNPQERTLSKDFIGGLIVGEGWFGLTVQKTPRLKTKYGFTIRPRFAIHMNDEETMDMLRNTLRQSGAGFYTPRSTHGNRIEIAGMKRVKVFIDWIGDNLTGWKKTAAEIVYEFIELRLSKKQAEPYGDEEFKLVQKIREHNAGDNKKVISIGELRDVRKSHKKLAA